MSVDPHVRARMLAMHNMRLEGVAWTEVAERFGYLNAAQARGALRKYLERHGDPPWQDEPGRAARYGGVYVVVAPGLLSSPAWSKLRPVLRQRVKGAGLLVYSDLFSDDRDYRDNWKARLEACAGAVVVPSRKTAPGSAGPALWLGDQAVSEAEFVSGLPRPVLVLMTDGLVPWPAVAAALTRPERHPAYLPVCAGDVQVRSATITGPRG
ncbi:MAG: hypothetical protein WAL12_20980 [Trebonia sp.]